MVKLLICLGITIFILLLLIPICFDINVDTGFDLDTHIRDPFTGEIID